MREFSPGPGGHRIDFLLCFLHSFISKLRDFEAGNLQDQEFPARFSLKSPPVGFLLQTEIGQSLKIKLV